MLHAALDLMSVEGVTQFKRGIAHGGALVSTELLEARQVELGFEAVRRQNQKGHCQEGQGRGIWRLRQGWIRAAAAEIYGVLRGFWE